MTNYDDLQLTITVTDDLDVQIVPPSIPGTAGVILIRDADGDVAVFPFEAAALKEALDEAVRRLAEIRDR